MKLNVLSDLHLEFGSLPESSDVNTIAGDVTILAGDVGRPVCNPRGCAGHGLVRDFTPGFVVEV